MSEPATSAIFWDDVMAEALDRYKNLKEALTERVLIANGRPPLNEKRNPRNEYEQLLALRSARHPDYMTDPAAVARLEELSAIYGPPPDSLAPAPFEPPGGVPPPYEPPPMGVI